MSKQLSRILFLRLSVLLTGLCAAVPQVSQAATTWIYDNGAASWGDASFGSTPNYKSTAGAPLSGAYDIAISDTIWGAWQATAPSGFSLANYGSITFSLKPTVAKQAWTIYLTTTAGSLGTVLNVANYGPAPSAGKWGTYTIPLSAFAKSLPTIYSVVIQDQAGLSKNLWYIDNVGFVTGSGSVPTVTLSASPSTITSGSSSTLTWSSTNATVCEASGGWSGAQALSGSKSVTPTSTTTYSLYCTGAAGAKLVSATVTVNKAPAPVVTLTATPTSIATGASSTLAWSSTNATACTASGAWSGAQATSGSTSVTPTATSTYTLTCTGAGGSAQSSATLTVTVKAPVPTVTITANPTSIASGASSTLAWSSTNATACTATGAWSGTQSTSGSSSVSPTATSTYTLTCTGTGGSAQSSATVTVGSPSTLPDWVYVNGQSTLPADWSYGATLNYSATAGVPLSGSYDIEVDTTQWGAWQPYFSSLNLSPYTNFTIAIKPTVANQAFTLSFTVAGASSSAAIVNPFSYGPAPVVGQWGVYTIPLSALGVAGQTIQSFALQDQTGLTANTFYLDNVGFLPAGATANSLPPTVTISASPILVAPGASSTLTWSSTSAASCSAGGGWSGSLPTSGSRVITPAASSGYTISCVSSWGSSSASTGVTVTKPGVFAVQTAGGKFVNGNGAVIQMRGVNLSGLEFTAVDGYDPQDPTGGNFGQANNPNWSAIQAWKASIVRIPLNEDSWLGLTCTDTGGSTRSADPGNNYKQAVQNLVTEANQAGMYVILDLHWAAPGNACPQLQSQMADADHSLDFWTSVAAAYKSNPSVMFELFNEPFLDFDFTGDAWQYLMYGTGGSFSGYPASGNSGVWQNVQTPWNIASYQAMINAVRATGAANVVLIGSLSYTADLSGWLSHKPQDPLNQIAATWHAYPTFGATFGTAAYAQPNYSPEIFTEVLAIQAAGVPVIITETGDQDSAGTVGAPLVQTVTQFADANGISVLGWTWDVWGGANDVLIKDVNGTPTDGFGVFFQNWMVTHP